MRYSVGEVAHLLNMTPSALRFYETEHIIHAEKSPNGRRYYSQQDLTRLISCKKYSSMEIPIKTIAAQFKPGGDSRQVITERLQEKSAEAMEKASYYRLLSEIIREQAEALERIDDQLGAFSVTMRDGYYMLTDESHQLMSYDKRIRDVMNKWIQSSPAVKIAVSLPPAAPEAKASLAYLISEKHAGVMVVPLDSPNITYLPSCACIRTITHMEDCFVEPERIFAESLAYFSEKNITVSGTSIAAVLVVESLASGHYDTYLDITIPFNL